jgi:hypothetical protein
LFIQKLIFSFVLFKVSLCKGNYFFLIEQKILQKVNHEMELATDSESVTGQMAKARKEFARMAKKVSNQQECRTKLYAIAIQK